MTKMITYYHLPHKNYGKHSGTVVECRIEVPALKLCLPELIRRTVVRDEAAASTNWLLLSNPILLNNCLTTTRMTLSVGKQQAPPADTTGSAPFTHRSAWR